MLTSPLTCFLKAQITSLMMLHAEKFVTASGSEKDGAGLGQPWLLDHGAILQQSSKQGR